MLGARMEGGQRETLPELGEGVSDYLNKLNALKIALWTIARHPEAFRQVEARQKMRLERFDGKNSTMINDLANICNENFELLKNLPPDEIMEKITEIITDLGEIEALIRDVPATLH